MDNPQLVDYIRQHMAAGHTEATIRQHLVRYGWPADKVDAAFEHYNRSHVQSQRPPKRASKVSKVISATKRPVRRGKRKRLAATISILVVLVVAGIIFRSLHTHKTTPVPTPPARLTHQQEQTIDVITVGGAVGQYVAANNSTLPTRTAPGPDGNSVVLCGTSCDPTTWQVSALSAYKPAGVKIVPYAPGLTAPDIDTLLLVAGAKCSNDDLTTENITPLSMVAMYATDTSDGLKQYCVSL